MTNIRLLAEAALIGAVALHVGSAAAAHLPDSVVMRVAEAGVILPPAN